MKGSRRRKHDKAAQQAGTMTPRPNPAVALIGLWTAALFARAKAAVAVAAEPEPTTKLERELLRSEKSEALKRYRQEFLHRYRFGNNKFDPHQGPEECARRRRQIAAGFLTLANGLQL